MVSFSSFAKVGGGHVSVTFANGQTITVAMGNKIVFTGWFSVSNGAGGTFVPGDPLRLASSYCSKPSLLDGMFALVMGWGKEEQGQISTVLRWWWWWW